MASGHPADRVLLLEEMLDSLEATLALLSADRWGELLARYMGRCDMVGRRVGVREGGQSFEGVVEAIAPDYALVLRLADGIQRSFSAATTRLT